MAVASHSYVANLTGSEDGDVEGGAGKRMGEALRCVSLGAGLEDAEHLLVARGQVRRVTRGLDGVRAVEMVGGKLFV